MTETLYAPANWNKQLRKPTEAGLPLIGLSERAVFSEILQRCKNSAYGFFVDSGNGIAYSLQANVAVVGKAIKKLVSLGLVIKEKLSPYKSRFYCLTGAAYTHSDRTISTVKNSSPNRKNAAAAALTKSESKRKNRASLRGLNEALDLAAQERPTKSAQQQPRQIQSLQKKSRMSASTPKRETSPTPSKQLRKQEQQCPQSYRRPPSCVNSPTKAPLTTKTPKSYKRPLSGDSKKKSARVIRQGQDSSAVSKKTSKTPRRFVPPSSERPSFSDENEKRKWEARRRWHGRQQAQKIKGGDAYYTTPMELGNVNVLAALVPQNTVEDPKNSSTQHHQSSKTRPQNGTKPISNTSPAERLSIFRTGLRRWAMTSPGNAETPRTSRERDSVVSKSNPSRESLNSDSRDGLSFTEPPTGKTQLSDRSPETCSSKRFCEPSENERTIEHGDR